MFLIKKLKNVLTNRKNIGILVKSAAVSSDEDDRLHEICGCSSMARISAFQADCVGSIPITRSIFLPYYKVRCAPVAQPDRATAF